MSDERTPIDWRPIETAPKDGTSVMLYFPTWRQPFQVGRYEIEETFLHGKLTMRSEHWRGGPYAIIGKDPEPSHWAPLFMVPIISNIHLEAAREVSA